MGKTRFCYPKTRAIIINMYNNFKSDKQMADNVKCSKTMVFNAVQYGLKHLTTNNIPRCAKITYYNSRTTGEIVQESKKFRISRQMKSEQQFYICRHH